MGPNHFNTVFDERPYPSMVDKFEDEEFNKVLQEALANKTSTSLFSSFIEEEKTHGSGGT